MRLTTAARWNLFGGTTVTVQVDCDECGWSGDTDAEALDTGRYTSQLRWSCPRCEAPHEDDVDLTDDDRARDLAGDR